MSEQAAEDAEPRYYSGRRLRANLLQFGVGKVLNAAAAFFNFVLIARVLPVADYAAYSVIWSALFLSIFVSSVGVGAVAIDQLPRLREFAPARLPRMILGLIGVRLASLAVMAALLWAGAGLFLQSAEVSVTPEEMALAVPLMIGFGTLSFFQFCIFAPLYRQVPAQLIILLRTCLLTLLMLAATWSGEGLTLAAVLRLDLVAVGVSLLVAAALALPLLRVPAGAAGGPPAPLRALIRLALHDHASFMMKLSASGYALMLVAAHVLDPAGIASLGFVIALSEQVRTNLPAELLWRLVHPRLALAFQTGGDFAALNRACQLLYKASLAVLGPGLVVVAAFGPQLMDFLSGGKFAEAWPLMLLMLATLVPWSHSIILWGVAVICGRPDALSRSALWALATIPLALLGALAGLGPYGFVGAIAITVVAQNGMLLAVLRRAGFPYAVDFAMVARFAAAVIAGAALLAAALMRVEQAGLGWVLAACGGAGAAFLGFGLATRFAGAEDRRLARRLIAG